MVSFYSMKQPLHLEKAEYKTAAAVRKMDEEPTINLKCIIGVLMTDSGLLRLSVFPSHRNHANADMTHIISYTLKRKNRPQDSTSHIVVFYL